MSKFTKLLIAMAKGREIVIKFRNGRIESGRFIDGNRRAIRIEQAANVDTIGDLPFGDLAKDTIIECVIQLHDVQHVKIL